MTYEETILKIINKNPERSKNDFLNINQLIRDNNLAYKGNYVRTLAIPKVISAEQYRIIETFIEQMFLLFDKVIELYFRDPNYRSLFAFPPQLEALILASRRRHSWVPMARIDFFLEQKSGDIMMCEINTDGTSAMYEDNTLGKLLTANSAFQDFVAGREYRLFELFDSWVTAFIEDYSSEADDVSTTAKNAQRVSPRVAIVDFLDVGYLVEFEHFQAAFLRQGIECEICDIRELTFADGVLRTKSGMVIDAIYRRAVTSDIMRHEKELAPFLQAVTSRAVHLIGDFVTQIVHNKRFFYIIHHPLTQTILSESEREFITCHFPATYPLTEVNLRTHLFTDMLAHDNYEEHKNWIIKPCDSYGAKGFFAGKNFTKEKWYEVCREHLNADYILQRFHRPYLTANIDFAAQNPVVANYSNLTGVFCYNGKARGMYSRMADGDIISTQYDEKTVATVVVGF
ncbi:MAG: hypothetical protein LBC96_05470 [Lachnospiraceae bacterium]|jgi:glutathionylspermidine synthase|nr:hypothetical protein [Lachnospiraceae bacterium]